MLYIDNARSHEHINEINYVCVVTALHEDKIFLKPVEIFTIESTRIGASNYVVTFKNDGAFKSSVFSAVFGEYAYNVLLKNRISNEIIEFEGNYDNHCIL